MNPCDPDARRRTWPYGSRLFGTVQSMEGVVTIVATDDGEAHVLIGVIPSIPVRLGARVEMEFTPGGPMGGFWKIIAVQG